MTPTMQKTDTCQHADCNEPVYEGLDCWTHWLANEPTDDNETSRQHRIMVFSCRGLDMEQEDERQFAYERTQQGHY